MRNVSSTVVLWLPISAKPAQLLLPHFVILKLRPCNIPLSNKLNDSSTCVIFSKIESLLNLPSSPDGAAEKICIKRIEHGFVVGPRKKKKTAKKITLLRALCKFSFCTFLLTFSSCYAFRETFATRLKFKVIRGLFRRSLSPSLCWPFCQFLGVNFCEDVMCFWARLSALTLLCSAFRGVVARFGVIYPSGEFVELEFLLLAKTCPRPLPPASHSLGGGSCSTISKIRK